MYALQIDEGNKDIYIYTCMQLSMVEYPGECPDYLYAVVYR